MDNPETYERLTPIMRKVFKDEALTPHPQMTAREVKRWDSLAHVRFIIEVERGFGIKFATSEIAKFKSVGDLVEMIDKKRAG